MRYLVLVLDSILRPFLINTFNEYRVNLPSSSISTSSNGNDTIVQLGGQSREVVRFRFLFGHPQTKEERCAVPYFLSYHNEYQLKSGFI